MAPQIDRNLARKVLEVVDAGLVYGMGEPVPGKMCVEAAVCYAMGLPHSDEPTCVSPALRCLKIQLNDLKWSSDKERAYGLRRLAIAQLGSAGVLDDKEFVLRVAEMAIRITVPRALLAAARIQKDEKHKLALTEAAKRCQNEGTREAADAAARAADATYAARAADATDAARAAYAAYAAANAAAAAAAYAANAAVYAAANAADADARDKELAGFAEAVVHILIEMKAPGCEFLDLTVG